MGALPGKSAATPPPALVPPDAGESGEIAFRLFLDPSLASSWNGVLSLRFDQAQARRAPPEVVGLPV